MPREEMTVDEFRRAASAKPSKYRNHKTMVDGFTFDSKREAMRWLDLRSMHKAGAILDLQRQVRFEIVIGGTLVCAYVADFAYWEKQHFGGWEWIVEDAKGLKTDVYKVKRKLMRAVYGIEIRET